MATEVPRKRTPLGLDAAAQELSRALQERLDAPITRELAEILLAHIWLENGRGASIICHNWGNISTFPSWGHDYWRPSWYEIDENSSERDLKEHAKMKAGKSPQAFRAYATHQDGLRVYLGLLKRKLSAGINAARIGDTSAFAQTVWDSKYCRDYACRPEILGPSLTSLANEFREKELFSHFPKAPELPPEPAPSPSPSSEDTSPIGPFVRGRREVPDLRWGNNGSAVGLWQRLLGDYYDGALDADFGPLTHHATWEWQARHELLPDGWVGHRTWGAVGEQGLGNGEQEEEEEEEEEEA